MIGPINHCTPSQQMSTFKKFVFMSGVVVTLLGACMIATSCAMSFEHAHIKFEEVVDDSFEEVKEIRSIWHEVHEKTAEYTNILLLADGLLALVGGMVLIYASRKSKDGSLVAHPNASCNIESGEDFLSALPGSPPLQNVKSNTQI